MTVEKEKREMQRKEQDDARKNEKDAKQRAWEEQ
jgi:hypothetical protein